eukprot:scaffold56473_cov66-Phaeocystis_antarctica.AAC.1
MALLTMALLTMALLTMALLTMALLTMALLLEARRELGCAPLHISVQEALEHGTEDAMRVADDDDHVVLAELNLLG